MAELNQFNCIGRLTRDPELKYTQGGTAVTSFSLAINRTYKQNDEKKQETCFIDVTAWGRMGEVIAQFIAKGAQVFITGRLQLDKWQDRNSGENRQKIKLVAENIQFLDSKRRDGDGNGGRGGGGRPRGDEPSRDTRPAPPDEDFGVDDEDVPF